MDRRPKKGAVFVCRYSAVDTAFSCHNLSIEEIKLEEIIFQMISKQIEMILSEQFHCFDMQTAQKQNFKNKRICIVNKRKYSMNNISKEK